MEKKQAQKKEKCKPSSSSSISSSTLPMDPLLQTVEIIKRPGQGLGLYIREGNGRERSDGVFISRLAPDSVAEQNSLLRVGDEILAVNSASVQGRRLEDVVISMSIPKRLVLAVKKRPLSTTTSGSSQATSVSGLSGVISNTTSGVVTGDETERESTPPPPVVVLKSGALKMEENSGIRGHGNMGHSYKQNGQKIAFLANGCEVNDLRDRDRFGLNYPESNHNSLNRSRTPVKGHLDLHPVNLNYNNRYTSLNNCRNQTEIEGAFNVRQIKSPDRLTVRSNSAFPSRSNSVEFRRSDDQRFESEYHSGCCYSPGEDSGDSGLSSDNSGFFRTHPEPAGLSSDNSGFFRTHPEPAGSNMKPSDSFLSTDFNWSENGDKQPNRCINNVRDTQVEMCEGEMHSNASSLLRKQNKFYPKNMRHQSGYPWHAQQGRYPVHSRQNGINDGYISNDPNCTKSIPFSTCEGHYCGRAVGMQSRRQQVLRIRESSVPPVMSYPRPQSEMFDSNLNSRRHNVRARSSERFSVPPFRCNNGMSSERRLEKEVEFLEWLNKMESMEVKALYESQFVGDRSSSPYFKSSARNCTPNRRAFSLSFDSNYDEDQFISEQEQQLSGYRANYAECSSVVPPYTQASYLNYPISAEAIEMCRRFGHVANNRDVGSQVNDYLKPNTDFPINFNDQQRRIVDRDCQNTPKFSSSRINCAPVTSGYTRVPVDGYSARAPNIRSASSARSPSCDIKEQYRASSITSAVTNQTPLKVRRNTFQTYNIDNVKCSNIIPGQTSEGICGELRVHVFCGENLGNNHDNKNTQNFNNEILQNSLDTSEIMYCSVHTDSPACRQKTPAVIGKLSTYIWDDVFNFSLSNSRSLTFRVFNRDSTGTYRSCYSAIVDLVSLFHPLKDMTEQKKLAIQLKPSGFIYVELTLRNMAKVCNDTPSRNSESLTGFENVHTSRLGTRFNSLVSADSTGSGVPIGSLRSVDDSVQTRGASKKNSGCDVGTLDERITTK